MPRDSGWLRPALCSEVPKDDFRASEYGKQTAFGRCPPPLAPAEGAESTLDAYARSAERYAEKARADGAKARYREHWA
ncbi:MAG: hypothetical protein RL701_2075 [Pseudomonadota bacterium]|jgi:hypothetical protein